MISGSKKNSDWQLIAEKTFAAERALYGLRRAALSHCTFAGPEDGESALKEAEDLEISACHFALRYPLWHVRRARLEHSAMTETCRAAIWYASDLQINDCRLAGIKALRETRDAVIANSAIKSNEFGWFCQNIQLLDSTLESEYAFLHSREITAANLQFTGKYSFQYVENCTFENCRLDTKDAFWHSNYVTVRNSELKGEYLGWYSHNLTLENCHISGTQPLCYAENLRLINCTMDNCDLAFEKSTVEATICGHLDSIKEPYQGTVKADTIGRIVAAD